MILSWNRRSCYQRKKQSKPSIKKKNARFIIHIFISQILCLYIHRYLLRFNFWKPIPKLLIHPFIALMIQTNIFPCLQKSFPSFAYMTWRVKCCVYNTYLFKLKLIMELKLDHLCSKWMPIRGSTLMRQCLLFLETVLHIC